jgi:hypothetical protein
MLYLTLGLPYDGPMPKAEGFRPTHGAVTAVVRCDLGYHKDAVRLPAWHQPMQLHSAAEVVHTRRRVERTG